MRIPGHARSLWAGLILLLALPLGGCDRIAGAIPGEVDPADLPATATPTLVSPSLAPGGGAAIADAELARSVVQVQAMDGTRTARVGSGVVVDTRSRLVLTSYGVVAPYRIDGGPAYGTIVISTSRDGGVPAPEFEAEIAAAEPATDIAVLRIVRDAGQPSLTEGRFNMPAVALGDARAANAGTPLRLFGYPGPAPDGSPGPQNLSITKAAVAGVRGVAGSGGRTWLKMDARVGYGLAGGPAFSQGGALLGILAQERYLPTGEIGEVRPLDLALAVIDRARGAQPGQRYVAPLYMTGNAPGSTRPLASDAMWIGRPSFASSAIEVQGTRDVFDYETRFAAGRPALYYEYVLEGVPMGTVIEERWSLDGLHQDSLSSSYRWDGRGFGRTADRITVPGAAGVPRGRWRIEVWANGQLRSQATALVAVEPRQPEMGGWVDGTLAKPDATPEGPAAAGAKQILIFFDFKGMEGVQQIDWVVFHDNRRVYASPPVRWTFGDAGRSWVGYATPEGLAAGKWEFEFHADGKVMGTPAVTVR